MKRSTTLAGGIALAIAAAYPLSVWYLGSLVENLHRQQLQEQLSAAPYIKLVRQDYDRRFFEATQTVTLEIPPEMFELLRLPARPGKDAAEAPASGAADGPQAEAPPQPGKPVADAAAAATPTPAASEASPAVTATPAAPSTALAKAPTVSAKPILLTVNTEIKHGPFPGFGAFGAALAESSVSFDAETQKKIDAAFAGKSPLAVRTLFGFSGGGHAVLSSPPFHYKVPAAAGESEFVWVGEGVEASVDFTRGLRQYTMSGNAPRFELSGSDGRLVFNNLALSASLQRIFDDEPLLYAGKQRFTLNTLDFIPAAQNGDKAQIKSIVYDFNIPAPGEFIDIIMQFGAEEFRLADKNYGPVHYDFSLRHINARKFVVFNRALMDLYRKPANADDDFAAAFKPLFEPMKALTLDNAEFVIDRLSANMPEGEAKASAKIKLNNAARQDWENPLLLVGKLELAADLSVPESLLLTFSTDDDDDAEAKKEAMARNLSRFAEQGYITRDQGIVRGKIEFTNGKLTVNGKPLDMLNSLLGQMPK